jgi:hypothetical protein
MLTAIRRIASAIDLKNGYKYLNINTFVGDPTFGVAGAGTMKGPGIWISASLLAGCAPHGVHPLRPLEILTAHYKGAVTTGMTGTLLYEGGCLLFRDDNKRVQVLPIWPDGSTFNGTSVTFHEPGHADQRIVVGEEFLMEGQPLQWPRVPGSRAALHQQHCGSQPFAVLGIRPAN